MPSSARLSLPLLSVGQAQKELTHNEALVALDHLVQATCSRDQSNGPPIEPVGGLSYLVGSDPVGAWTDQPNAVASFTASGWRFAAPFEGMTLQSVPDGATWQFLDGQWNHGTSVCNEVRVAGKKVVGAQYSAVAFPSGGATMDIEARSAIAEIIAALQQHGLIAQA